jgi:hypothetical protein
MPAGIKSAMRAERSEMSTAITKPQTEAALSTVENTARAIAAAAQEEGANELGTLVKYTKGLYHMKDDEVPLGTEFIAHVEHWVRGYVKFKGGSLIEHRVGRVTDGFVVPTREELDDTDPTLWEKSPSGEPKDPWTKQSYLPLEDLASGEIVTFVSGSFGGRQAISKLCSQASRHLATMGLPIIALGTESYKHKAYGRTDKPVFNIVRWASSPSEDAPASRADVMDDAIPF